MSSPSAVSQAGPGLSRRPLLSGLGDDCHWCQAERLHDALLPVMQGQHAARGAQTGARHLFSGPQHNNTPLLNPLRHQPPTRECGTLDKRNKQQLRGRLQRADWHVLAGRTLAVSCPGWTAWARRHPPPAAPPPRQQRQAPPPAPAACPTAPPLSQQRPCHPSSCRPRPSWPVQQRPCGPWRRRQPCRPGPSCHLRQQLLLQRM